MTPPLGDVFPEALKEMFPAPQVDIRTIVKVKIPEFTEANYPKWAVLVSVSSCGNFFGAVPINTIPPLNQDYAKILKSEHDFLEYDSYISCATLVEFSIVDLKALILTNPNKEFGTISIEKHNQVISILKNSKTIKRKLLKSHKLFY